MTMTIQAMSISAAVLIAVIIVIRALAIHHLPKKMFLVLWIAALGRLLVPFSIASDFSIYTFFRQIGTFVPERLSTVMPDMAAVNMELNGAGAVSAGTAVQETTTAAMISPIMIAWMIGAAAIGIYFVVSYRKHGREFKASLPASHPYLLEWLNEHRIARIIQIRVSDKIMSPLTYGIVRPVILLPKNTDWNDKQSLDYVLTHELVHIKRFDALTKIILAAALCVHWFNPLVWAMYILANRDLELSCDETVLRTFGKDSVSSYALTLIGGQGKRAKLSPLVSGFSKRAIIERINAIMKYKKLSITAVIIAAVMVIGIATVFATSPPQSSDGVETPFISNQADEETYSIYAPFGLTISGGALYYDGELVRCFDDQFSQKNFSVGAIGYYKEYGIVDVRAVREDNVLTGLEVLSVDEFDKNTKTLADSEEEVEVTAAQKSVTVQSSDMFSEYTEYGLIYDGYGLFYNEERVRVFMDVVTELPRNEISNWDKKGTLDVYAVRDSGKLSGLRLATQDEFAENTKMLERMPEATTEWSEEAIEWTQEEGVGVTIAEENVQYMTDEEWQSLLDDYEKFGLTYTADRFGEKFYYNGELVRYFVDNQSGNRDKFSGTVYEQNNGGSYYLRTLRDSDNQLIGIEEIDWQMAEGISTNFWRT